MDMEHTDLLEDILHGLPPRALAISRSVCKAWRATVDHCRLVQAGLLPLSLHAVIYNIDNIDAPKLVARRSTTRYITSRLDYLDNRPDYAEVTGEITDYCNSLLLIETDKTTCGRCYNNRYLVYDPTVSPHYEVFYVPRVPRNVPDDVACSTEWPPLLYVMHVFSSVTNCWRERYSHWKSDGELYYSAHWQGSLYVPLRHNTNGDFVMRLICFCAENAVTTVDWPKKGSPGAPAHLFWCLGFHPYKEIALFHDDYRSPTFAYQLNSSKVRYLGIMDHEYSDVDISFAYTPCWTMDLPGRK
ncbi:hypothetical protein VPH35_135077 [Triticum aestivum]